MTVINDLLYLLSIRPSCIAGVLELTMISIRNGGLQYMYVIGKIRG